MSSWMNDAAAAPNHNGNNGFMQMNDPTTMVGGGGMMMDPSAFMANAGQFNPAAAGQFANPQQMAAMMQNGPMRNTSPSFQNPVYQTNSVIPSKRPRPREDSINASPRQGPGMLPTSRANTPQQSPFPGFQPNAMGQQTQGQHQQYPHLQPNGSTNASPSPVMAGNQLRPGSVPQRVSTASPHPFSPATQQFNSQTSPVMSDHTGTPQPNPYMQNQGFPQGFNSNYTPSPTPARPPSVQTSMPQQMMPQQMAQMGQMPPQMQQMHPSQIAQMQQMQQMQQMAQAGRGMDPQQQKMLYQMRLQQQLQQGNMQMAAQMHAQNIGQGRGMMPNKQGVLMANGQMAPNNMQQHFQMQANRIVSSPEVFTKALAAFMATQGLPVDGTPIIQGRPLHLLQLFAVMTKFGFYRNVASRGMWPQVASACGFHPQQFPAAIEQIKGVYERNLLKFEDAWLKLRQRGTPIPGTVLPGTPQRIGPQGQQGIQPGQQQMQQPHAQTPIKQMPPGMQSTSVNGFSTPQQNQMSQPRPAAQGHMRNSQPRSLEATPVSGDFPMQSPASAGKPGSMSMQPPHGRPDSTQANGAAFAPPPPVSSDPNVYTPCSRPTKDHRYGGLELETIQLACDGLEQWRPDIPPALELGLIDLHALTRSLQCGIHGEVRLALDTLGTITHEAWRVPQLSIELKYCDDLMESLVDCAEEQVDILAEATKPVSDEIDLSTYEDVMRSGRMDTLTLKRPSIVGDGVYELDHSIDRLLAITTILRNLSFVDPNQPVLADEPVIKFLCNTIRSLGTLENLLRSPGNTLDFMKDVIILLSNIAAYIELPSREQAFCLLQFLLAFAPSPAPSMNADRIIFPSFEPAVHPYLPHAVDALAKLLARDEPNRTHYKTIFALDASTTPPCELLTRTFALAISPIPDQTKAMRLAPLPPLVEARKPMIMQGLLAADIVASLAPGYESGVTRAWLSSSEGFAQNLLYLIRMLCSQSDSVPPLVRGNMRRQPQEDPDVLHIIFWGVLTLRTLSEKARDPNDPSSIPVSALPSREHLFSTLLGLRNPKWAALLKQLSAFAGMAD